MADDSSPVVWRFKRPKVPVQLPAPKSSRKKTSRRQQFLSNVLFEHQAVETGANDESLSVSDNSDDDNCDAKTRIKRQPKTSEGNLKQPKTRDNRTKCLR
jgi:hypothetical protein